MLLTLYIVSSHPPSRPMVFANVTPDVHLNKALSLISKIGAENTSSGYSIPGIWEHEEDVGCGHGESCDGMSCNGGESYDEDEHSGEA